MDFYNIVIFVALVLLIISLVLYGLSFKSINPNKFPESSDECPTQWIKNGNVCINPSTSDCSGGCNRVVSIPGNTPGGSIGINGFNPADPGWATYSGAKSSICGKQKWALENNILWNGVNTYQC